MGDEPAHYHGTDHRAYAPETVKEAEMSGFVVQGHIIVEAGIDSSSSETVWNGKEAKVYEPCRNGEAP